MDSREDLPRVSVETVKDWERLKSNYKQAALARLDGHLNGTTTLERDALVAHLNEFIDQTFKIAEPNLRINGHTFESLDQDGQNMEPFDEALDRRIWSLADTRLQWHKRIAEARRQTPVYLKTSLLDLLRQRQVDDNIKLVDEATTEESTNEGDDGILIPHYEQLRNGFQKTSALGMELDQVGYTATVIIAC
ncbi:hypothetical protein BDQ12DRAFT_732446 [Crucibulum laeve]|uniref:Uncharacterized protein n=1 Tax=Crucibulum laeve TaxID=68775 RepID=A0A5C3MD62_9AGAR|nr:hypothetical protein BDQ12DRAFT_732446 [Crucibulum laeve]